MNRVRLLKYTIIFLFVFPIYLESAEEPLERGTCTGALKKVVGVVDSGFHFIFPALDPTDDIKALMERFATPKQRLEELVKAMQKNKPARFLDADQDSLIRMLKGSEVAINSLSDAAIREFIQIQAQAQKPSDLIHFVHWMISGTNVSEESILGRAFSRHEGTRSLFAARWHSYNKRLVRPVILGIASFVGTSLAVVFSDYVRAPLAPMNDRILPAWYQLWYKNYSLVESVVKRNEGKAESARVSMMEIGKKAALMPPDEFERAYRERVAQWAKVYSFFKEFMGGTVAVGNALDNDARTLFYPTIALAKNLENRIDDLKRELLGSASAEQKKLVQESVSRAEKDLAQVLIQMEIDTSVYPFVWATHREILEFRQRIGFERWVVMAGGRESIVAMTIEIMETSGLLKQSDRVGGKGGTNSPNGR